MKRPVSESLFNTVAGLQPGTLSMKVLRCRCFLLNFAKCFTSYLQNTFGQLLLENHWILLQMVPTAISKAIYQEGLAFYVFWDQLWSFMYFWGEIFNKGFFFVLEFFLCFKLVKAVFSQINCFSCNTVAFKKYSELSQVEWRRLQVISVNKKLYDKNYLKLFHVNL